MHIEAVDKTMLFFYAAKRLKEFIEVRVALSPN
jgi:hypothetical protein